MIIELTNENYILAGLAKAKKGDYYDALCLFNRADCYEATVNSIVCLCLNGDNGYGADLYKMSKQRYPEYDLYFDVTECGGDAVVQVVAFCEQKVSTVFERKGLEPNKDLLFFFEGEIDEGFVNVPDLDYFGDSSLWDNAPRPMYDLHSVDYYEYLRTQLEKSYIDGDYTRATSFSKRFLNVDTTHQPTVEAQLSVALFSNKHKKAVALARIVADSKDATAIGIASSIEAVNRSGSKDTKLLEKLLKRALKMGKDMTDYDLEDYVELATMKLGDVKLAYSFAELLFKNYKNNNVESLKVCVSAFYNAGKNKKAIDSAMLLSSAVPFDFYGKCLINYLSTHCDDENQGIGIPSRISRHFCLPVSVMLYTQKDLIERTNSDNLVLEKKDYLALSAIFAFSKAMLLEGRQDTFIGATSLARSFVQLLEPSSVDDFVDFAKRELFATFNEASLCEVLIAKLIRCKYTGKAYVGLTNSYYELDFSQVEPCTDDFVNAFSCVASLVDVDGLYDKLLNAYKTFSVLDLPENDAVRIHALAYAMACEVIPSFCQSHTADVFGDDEKQFYLNAKRD